MNTENAEGREVAPERAPEPWVLQDEVARLGYEFRDDTLLRAALIPLERRSVGQELTFSRLAILGGMVFRFALADYLYRCFEDESPGNLNLRQEALVLIESQSKVVRRLGLERFVFDGGADTPNVSASVSAHVNCYRALAGAVFLDGGWQAAAKFIECSMREELENLLPHPPVDNAKTRLRNWCQSHRRRPPIYKMLSRSALGEKQMFHAEVRVEGAPKVKARGSGSSCKIAEHAAAENLLEQLPPRLRSGATKRLKGWCGWRGLKFPAYEELGPSGAHDESMFHVVVRIEGPPEAEARGSGSTRFKARSAAAENLLEQLLELSTIPWVLPSEIPHLGYDFSKPSLLRAALIPPVRRSFAEVFTFQRLEFLGDRVLSLAVMARLYHQFKDETGGDLHIRLDALIANETWRKVALRLCLERFVLYDGGEQPTESMLRQKAIPDCYEALAGAVFLDGGWEAAVQFMKFSLRDELENQPPRPPIDAKTRLSNWCEACDLSYPVYEVLEQSGSDDDPVFHVEVRIEGPPKAEARGSGGTRAKAENAAAEKLLEKLDVDSRR